MNNSFAHIYHFSDFNNDEGIAVTKKQVMKLASDAIEGILEKHPEKIDIFLVATTCPDAVAPSVAQCLQEKWNERLGNCTAYDLVQGCAGGVAALILASQLASTGKTVLIVAADAARKATSDKSSLHSIFGNGAFACVVKDIGQNLVHTSSRQYPGLSEVVKIRLGHDADEVIKANPDSIVDDPRFHLGLNMNESLALKLIRNAENFYLDFIREKGAPDVLILHQASTVIITHLKNVFSKYPIQFIDVAAETGNCGAATLGIAFAMKYDHLKGKKVMLCGYGTGGVITAGMWQL